MQWWLRFMPIADGGRRHEITYQRATARVAGRGGCGAMPTA